MRSVVPRSARAAGLATCLLLVGCASGVLELPTALPTPTDTTPAVPVPTASVTHGRPAGSTVQPPPFLVRFDGIQLELWPDTFCYQSANSGVCADGFDPDPASVGSPEEIFVLVQATGMSRLTVTQTEGEGECSRSLTPEAKSLGNGWWVVHPLGPDATYRVALFASGEGASDTAADLLWKIRDAQPVSQPSAPCSRK